MIISSDFKFSAPKGFITVDGVNGAGKGTFIKKLNDYLRQKGIEAFLTREPGGSDLGLRQLILSKKFQGPLTELFLFAADRNEHIYSKILPAIRKKQLVISDRYYYSTAAFQGYGRGLDLNIVNYINKINVGEVLPDLFILLDIDPEIGIKRTHIRNSTEYDKMEDEELDFHKRLRNGFLELSNTIPEPCLIVDASQSADEVFDYIIPTIDKLLATWKTN